MKIITISDLHGKATAPLNRKDPYVEAWFGKLKYVIDYANDVGGVLVIAGDMFDKPTCPIWFVNQVNEYLGRLRGPGIIIPGNHDAPGHTVEFIRESALWTVHKAEHNCKLYPLGSWHIEMGEDEDEVVFHTVPFNSDASLLTPVHRAYNVLVAHMPVFESAVPFYMKDGLTVNELESKYPGFDLYLVGDIHIPTVKSKTIVSGSMMRTSIIQKDFQPRFYEIDTGTGQIIEHFFPIESDVWKEQVSVVADDAWSVGLKKFSEVLKQRTEKLDYRQVVEGLSVGNETINNKIGGLIDEYHSTTGREA